MKRAAAIVLVLGASAAGTAHANPADIFGFGARGAALAGAQVADARDGSAAYYNPALLAGFDDIRIDLGYQAGLPSLTVNGRDLGVDSSHGMSVDIVVPGQLGGHRIAIGAALFLPDQWVTRTRSLPSQQPRFALYDNRPQRLMLTADAALELLHGLWVGGGLAYMSSTVGTVKLKGLIGFPEPEQSNLALDIDVDLKTIRYAHAGVAWRATPWLELGASYRGGFKLQIEQRFRIDGDVGTPGADPIVSNGYLDLYSASQDLFQPAELTAGGSMQLTPANRVDFDLGYHRWSRFENPAAHITLDLDIGQFNQYVHIPPPVALPVPHYHDIVVPRIGVEHVRGPWSFRAGYLYEPTPVPDQIGETNFIDNDKHEFSLGAGVERPHLTSVIPRPFDIDAFVALTLLVPRDTVKLSPVDTIGDYRAAGHVISAGITSRWQF